MTTNATPRSNVLVAEDDAASGEFFRLALERAAHHVTVHADGIAALEDASRRHFDLLVLDRHLPGAGAEDILTRLRADTAAASRTTPALATSAEVDEGTRRHLRDMGFVDVLAKPLTVSRLHQGVREALAGYAATPPLLDDDAAVEQSGSAQSVAALRSLFVEELQRLTHDLEQAPPPAAALADRMHRLMASCGFCGASALATAAAALKRQLDQGHAASGEDLRALCGLARETLEALVVDEQAAQAD